MTVTIPWMLENIIHKNPLNIRKLMMPSSRSKICICRTQEVCCNTKVTDNRTNLNQITTQAYKLHSFGSQASQVHN